MQNWIDAYSWINIRFLLQGLSVTILISVISVVLSFIFGSVLGIVRYSKIPYLSRIIGFVIDVIRNLPLLLIIFFVYFGLPAFGFKPDTIPAAILAMTVFESMMIAEIIRSGIMAVDIGQMEASRAMGMTFTQAMWHIVLPQAYKKMIPALVSQFISLIKDTSLATIIVVPELMQHGQVVYGQDPNYIIPVFVAMALMYFVVCYALSLLSKYIDHKMA
ncbi:amino acid ABC transporter permease [Companilactobacillus pabuli]|jgi:putative glutamine transport system permease protein|uniref:Amino acid ABC transporter permease n=1 Tax=Companilactobacillus pabuli TaxID=2714036 RepID=A0A7L7L0G1_9LACO|nr:amino acid ABC transporter permease [Companilactobacillus pabuli]AKP02944.1 glutamine ABC transporter permease [Companilactobacillus farciminis]MCI1285659.1 amino acid ABC transporter permease [Pediococcus pentosaceus]AKS51244.1 glutamine ABC transporter permease [Companilactobacillus farciminis]MDG5112017.1 amino acid ABC transporter permease [Companilactobacillus pabuli]QMT85132.1 amino acid ABC transporter permease [Companilactobacillus pabuli]